MPHLVETALTLWPARYVRAVVEAEFFPEFEVWEARLECGHTLAGLTAIADRLPCDECRPPRCVEDLDFAPARFYSEENRG